MKALCGLRSVATIGVVLLLVGTGAPPLRARSAAAAQHRTLWVFAAASLSDAFAEIEQGAAADVFASADDRWMAHLRDRGLLAGDSKVFVRNRLVVIIPKTNPARIRRLQDLMRGGV